MPPGRLDDVAPGRTAEVRVVEDDASRPVRELVVERRVEVAERAAALVAVQADVALLDEPLRDAALAGAGDAHHEDDLGRHARVRPAWGGRAVRAERRPERLELPRVEIEP